MVMEALKRGRSVFDIYLDQGAGGEKIEELISLAKKNKVNVIKASRQYLDKLSKTESHQGVIATAEALKARKLSNIVYEIREPFIVVLREVLYEHNLGAVLRTACASGVDAVVVPPSNRVVVTPIVERVSMGASNCVPVVEEGIYSALSILKKAGVLLIGVEISGRENYFDADLTGPVAMVLGGENEGLSLPILEKCDIVVRVPMANGMQSLNQSVAAGILMFERVRQKNYEQTV